MQKRVSAGIYRLLTDFFWTDGQTSYIFMSNNLKVMKNRDHFVKSHREHHPRVSLGLFLITLGVALLIATNDMLNLGSVGAYFTWQTASIFVGVLLLLNLRFLGGLILISVGVWFLLEHMDYELSEIIRTIYWPSVIILAGLGFILSSFIKRKNRNN
jgi:hypothetical protein